MTPQTSITGLQRLNRELSDREVRCELCAVAGSVLGLVFTAAPRTRNVRALFQPYRLLEEAIERVRADLALEETWLEDALRSHAGSSGGTEAIELSNLLVYDAPLEYLLAMKCASFTASQRPRDRDDISLLMRLLHLSNSDAALQVVHRYFNERQLPDDLESLLRELGAG